MKFKKFGYSVSVVALSALMLSACSTTAQKNDSSSSSSKTTSVQKKEKQGKKIAGGELKDGTYKLEEDNYFNGYRAELSMTVKDGKITKTSYDQVNKDGKSKADDAKYEKMMKKYAKIGPKEYIPKLRKEFADNGSNTNAIQVVSGATGSTRQLRNYVNQLVQAAQKGDTATIHIDNNNKMKDGTYKLEQENYNNGYRQVYTLTVKDHKIADLKYDQINKDGKSKTENKSYEKMMKKAVKVGPKEYIPELRKEFLKAKGDTEKIQVVSGATESSNDFISYVQQLINAAQKGDTNTIKVDNYVYKH